MRVMVLVKASNDSESGAMPIRQKMAEMGKFNDELVKAGIMLARIASASRSHLNKPRVVGQVRLKAR